MEWSVELSFLRGYTCGTESKTLFLYSFLLKNSIKHLFYVLICFLFMPNRFTTVLRNIITFVFNVCIHLIWVLVLKSFMVFPRVVNVINLFPSTMLSANQ